MEKMDYKRAIFTEKKVEIMEDHVLIKWRNGVVYEYGPKSEETKKYEQEQMEKEIAKEIEDDIECQMSLAVEEMEERRENYRMKDLLEYGYDKYTNDFYYEIEDSDSESEN